METRRLEYFHALAEDGNFSRTAERLHISQSALSQQIQRLEAEIGAYLFDRSARPVALTEAGIRLLRHSVPLLEHVRAVDTLRSDAARGETGTLRIGLIPLALYGPLPMRIREFTRQHPDVRIRLHKMDTAALLDALTNGQLDVGFLNARPPAGGHATDLFEVPLRVALPSDHPLASRCSLKLRQLRSEPLIMFPREHAPENFDRVIAACMSAGFSPRVITETGDYASQIGYVCVGVGFALVPPDVNAIHRAEVVHIPLSPPLRLTMRIAWRQAKLDSHLRVFLAAINRTVKDSAS
ncbi:MAG: LysR family transcriptional regulator [Pseudonocardiaceae bacterium]|nr:LysR family transcriptional regulator [Pseudonocardiaceae bacterium]